MPPAGAPDSLGLSSWFDLFAKWIDEIVEKEEGNTV